MEDEIKELLDRINNYPEKLYCLNENEKHLLLDCITNLQEENKMYAQLKEEYEDIIDKAIEYINENKHLSMFTDCREPEEDWNYDLEINPRELLNILQGDDEDETNS